MIAGAVLFGLLELGLTGYFVCGCVVYVGLVWCCAWVLRLEFGDEDCVGCIVVLVLGISKMFVGFMEVRFLWVV